MGWLRRSYGRRFADPPGLFDASLLGGSTSAWRAFALKPNSGASWLDSLARLP